MEHRCGWQWNIMRRLAVMFAMGAANVTLYAKWTQNPTYTVTYNGNGSTSGSAPTDPNAYLQGATVTVIGNTGNLAKIGFTFTGWNTAADGSGTTYAAAATFTIYTANVTVTVYHDDDEAFDLWEHRRPAGEQDHPHRRPPTISGRWATRAPAGRVRRSSTTTATISPAGRPARRRRRRPFHRDLEPGVHAVREAARGKRVNLPRPSIDTGMGLERLAAVLQGKHDNYDIDLLRALIRASAEATGVDPDGPHKVSHRVIADHLRASSFLVADGVLPSNEGRGYVLRRIMRRAMRHAQLLGARDPLMWRLVPALVREMGQAYPELIRAEALIAETLKLEETRFRATLARGLAMLEDETRDLQRGGKLAGEIAFKLYDTYGFPLDLTQDALRARGLGVDVAASRRRWSASAPRRARPGPVRARPRPRRSGSPCASASARPNSWAMRLRGPRASSTALVARRQGGRRAGAGETGVVILNQTPFYAESGGQVGDIGVDDRRRACASRSATSRRSSATCSPMWSR